MKNLLTKIKRAFTIQTLQPMPPTDKEVRERRRVWIERRNEMKLGRKINMGNTYKSRGESPFKENMK